MRFTLTPVSGAPVVAVATLRVVTPHVVARRDIVRGQTVAGDDVIVLREEVRGIPLRRLPQGSQVIGGRALRPVPAGAVLLPGAVDRAPDDRARRSGDGRGACVGDAAGHVPPCWPRPTGATPAMSFAWSTPTRAAIFAGRVVREGRVEVLYAR